MIREIMLGSYKAAATAVVRLQVLNLGSPVQSQTPTGVPKPLVSKCLLEASERCLL